MLNLEEIIELRKLISDKFNTKLHYHDSCGGQYFSLDEKNDAINLFIQEYIANKGLTAVFSNDGLNITVKKN